MLRAFALFTDRATTATAKAQERLTDGSWTGAAQWLKLAAELRAVREDLERLREKKPP